MVSMMNGEKRHTKIEALKFKILAVFGIKTVIGLFIKHL